MCTKNWSVRTETMSGMVFFRNIFFKRIDAKSIPYTSFFTYKKSLPYYAKVSTTFRGKYYKERSIKSLIELSSEKDGKLLPKLFLYF